MLHLISVVNSYLESVHDIFVPKIVINDSETQLALGYKLNISSLNEYDLSLINGISDTMASLLFSKRSAVISKAKTLSTQNKEKALEIIKGIGPKKAIQFGKQIDVTR